MMVLANEEQSMSDEMAGELKILNDRLLQEAEKYLGLSINKIYNIARVPGKFLYAFGREKYSKDEILTLSKLLMDMGKFNYMQTREEDIEEKYWWETTREMFAGNIEIESIDYGKDNKLFVYNIPDYEMEDLKNKWEYSIIQQLMPMPVI